MNKFNADKKVWYQVAIWCLSTICFFVFILAASGKFAKSGNMYDNFLRWGYNYHLLVTVGILEASGATFLLIPKLRSIGISFLIVVMLGSIATHFSNFDEMGFPSFPIALISTLILVRFLSQQTKKLPQ